VRSTGPQWLPPSVVPSTVPGQCRGGVPSSWGTGHAGPCKLANPTLGPSKMTSCSCRGPDHTCRQTRPPSSVRNSSPGATVRAQRAGAMRSGQATVGATLSQAFCAPAATSPRAAPGPAHWRSQVFPPSSVPSTSTALVGCCSKLAVTASQPVLAPTKASCDTESSAPGKPTAATAARADAVAWGVLAWPQEAKVAAAAVPRPAKARAARGLSPSCVPRVTPAKPNEAARGLPDSRYLRGIFSASGAPRRGPPWLSTPSCPKPRAGEIDAVIRHQRRTLGTRTEWRGALVEGT
jgi:hypothetical protein